MVILVHVLDVATHCAQGSGNGHVGVCAMLLKVAMRMRCK